MDDAEFFHWYGPWASLSPPDAAELMAGLAAPWWIVGGWAIEAFTGVRREHEDVDIAFRAGDLPEVLDHLLAGYCVWSNRYDPDAGIVIVNEAKDKPGELPYTGPTTERTGPETP